MNTNTTAKRLRVRRMTPKARLLLATLWQHADEHGQVRNLTYDHLANEVGVGHDYIARILTFLKGAGALTIEREPDDKRRVIYHLNAGADGTK